MADKYPVVLQINSRSVITFCGCVVFCFGFLATLGHLTGFTLLASIRGDFIAMAPVTAFGFTIIGLLLVFGSFFLENRVYRWLASAISVGIILYGILKLIGFLLNTDLTFDTVLFRSEGTLGKFPFARMSVVTSILMILSGLAFLMKITGKFGRIRGSVVCSLGFVILFCGFVISIGYLFGTPFLYSGDVRPPAATSALTLMFLGCGLIAWSWRESVFLEPFSGNMAGARLIRAILPVIFLAILLEAYFSNAYKIKIPFNNALLSAVLTTLTLVVTTVVIVQISKRVFRRADLAEKQQEQSRKLIREGEEKLELFFSQSLDGFFFMMMDEPVEWKSSTDKEKALDYIFSHQRITKINDAMLQQYGSTREQFIGRTPANLFRHDPGGGRSLWRDFFDKGKLHVETDERRLDGTQLFVEGDYICLYDDQGRITGHFGIQRDVTERKMAEQKILRYTEELKESNASKDKFFSIISHDLKSPFSAILGFSREMINVARMNDPDQIEKFANHIYSSAERTYELLENLLQWAKTQQGTISYSPACLALEELLSEKFETLKYTAISKDITLDYSCDPELKVTADPEMLKSILRNLITNAIKFTNPGGRISIRAAAGSGEEVEVLVEDDGVGMREEDCQRLFRIDQNVSRPGTKKERGTGLGLILCKEFVEKNGGRIWVESEPGKGTRVSFTLRSCS